MSADAISTSSAVAAAMPGRLSKDRWFRYLVTLGGLMVIVAISSIFFYLASVVLPMFMPGGIQVVNRYATPGVTQQTTVHFGSEEQRQIGTRFSDSGAITFFRFADGAAIADHAIRIPQGVQVSSFAAGDPQQYVAAYGLSDGRAIVVRQVFDVTYPDDKRLITPRIEYPLGEDPIVLDDQGRAIRQIAVQHASDEATLVGLTEDGRMVVVGVTTSRNLISGEVKAEQVRSTLAQAPADVTHMILEVKQRDLYLGHGGGSISHFDVSNKERPRFTQVVQVAPQGERMTALSILSGGISLIVGTDRGSLVHWFLVRDAQNQAVLRRVRDFPSMDAAISVIAPEHYRKGFAAGDEAGNIGIYYATSQRLVATERPGTAAVRKIEFTPRANGILAEDAAGQVHAAHVDNEFPEVSWRSLWQKVWYETYQEPEYIWQSSAATSDFEPKFSLAPLTFGTLKAAFYAMLVSVPLAILGAIFTAYFMSPALRRVVKPSIEIMEALPTVILGFLAGLWLAPLVELNLAGTLLTLLVLPIALLGAAVLWQVLPRSLTRYVPPGWEAALLIPVVLFALWFAFRLGHPVEAAFFGGDMPYWLSNELGIPYEQRNSLVVGIAMGFAVTPTIFSIAEDAIFSVPKHLTTGSLALGATPWQTLMNVVLLTASPGIFSAVMIGLGRAVGETMIVLMATGNTAVMDMSIFTGFRTLSANIGVEMPEAAVGTTHYRLLFLSALVLFGFTFTVNTIAELVRQRLREKYSSL
jgi:phosphate transport system permease protein